MDPQTGYLMACLIKWLCKSIHVQKTGAFIYSQLIRATLGAHMSRVIYGRPANTEGVALQTSIQRHDATDVICWPAAPTLTGMYTQQGTTNR